MSDDGRAELGDSAFLTERTRVRQELERAPTNTASPDLAALYQRIGDESRRERMPQMGAGQLGVTILPRLLAVEVLQSWARRYTRFFLDSCPGISVDIAETAELVGSELVANAVTFGGGPAHIAWHPQRVGASIISLSLQNFREVCLSKLLIPTATRRFYPVLIVAQKMAEA